MNKPPHSPILPYSLLRGAIAEYAGLLGVLGVLVAVFSLSSHRFFARETFMTIANQAPAAAIVAVGMTFVLCVAEIDLSVGSIFGLSGVVLGSLITNAHAPLPAAIAACLGTGLACGAINGWVTTQWSLPSFIVTLGMLEMARGGAHLVSNSQTQYLGSMVGGIAETNILGLSLPFMLAVLLVIGGQVMLSFSVFGRRLVGVGANPEAVRLSGINPRPIKVAVLAISGFLAAAAAVIDTSRFQAADPNAGMGFELDAIAAVVIGGTSLLGGQASVVNSFLGVLIIGTLGAGLAALGVKDETKRLITGAVIVGAVILDRYRHRR